MSRKCTRLGLSAGITALALTLTACSGAATSAGAGASNGDGTEAEPIRVAVVSPHSGPYAEFGEQQRAGYQFAADEANANGGIDGRRVEIFVADDLGTNEGAVAAAQRLVQQKDAKFIVGTIATPTTLAVMQRLASWDALAFGTQSQGDALTGESCSPRFFRTNVNDHLLIQGVGKWLAERDATDWDSVAADYAFGHGSAEGLQQVADAKGWSVDKNLFAPLGTTDYASYLNQLDGGQGLLVSLSGGDSVHFLGQALDFGTLDKYDLIVGNAAMTTSSLNAVSDERLIGKYGTANWGPTVDAPESQAFVEAFSEANGEAPADFTGAAYMAMQTIFAGVRAAGSIDPSEVATALDDLTFDSIKGEVTMRAEDHQIEAPMYMGKVEKVGDRYDLVIEDTIPMSETMPEPDPACSMPEL
ncbi:ABC transporter substrate-binding protein [Georgenia ruanii]|uniref:ABC transporter substrate-binding protein n=1 Tax=Georgenia ruanii TaxID=348442 RepID=A0A7J9UTT0_9MICO|nr:ABC transporter substrate-binding protein [Georgenia ruanii]MPV88031.1 ABC transporter substrate-binding protein [Georgenia ruanii]